MAADGRPRLHPVAPILGDRGLFVAVQNRSPKLADLRSEPRMAPHSTVLPPDDEEFSIRGVQDAWLSRASALRAAAWLGAHPPA